MITFQELIRRLTHFWEKEGCIIHQGHDLEMGAGTFNPATFLRCLGPEGYKTAYVEPSRRPSDGRYGENPNRVQLFHQFQVIIKPSPPDIQATYLKSLEAIGLNLKKHDIRFVHDDWESPTLGAWGLGWEVWVDGMEATQFTYFQMVGSLPLKPISAELTYGLERLAMFIQGVDDLFDVHWNEELTFRDISKRSEVEWSTYNFKQASTEMWRRHFDDFEREAKDLIAKDLPLPAYDFVIKASHAFNILEARGVISVTERTGYIARIRDLSRLIASAYLASREKLGFPLAVKMEEPKLKLPPLPKKFNAKKRDDFLLEIGSEQLPATFVPMGMRNLETALRTLLEKEGIAFDSIQTFATPRRLAVKVSQLAEGTEAQTVARRGPKLQVAFGADGKLTKQGLGFFSSINHGDALLVDVEKGKIAGLTVKDDYIHYESVKEGKGTFAILAEALPQLILDLPFPKKMRWGNLDIAYPRPIHWIVALLGKEVVPFALGNVSSGNETWGHAQRDLKKISLSHPNDYLSKLKKHFVLADVEERKQSILEQLSAIEKKERVQALEKEAVLTEVLYLCEWPELTVSHFNPNFLNAPDGVLISEMVEHQRYFPLASQEGKLVNKFVITADNAPSDLIRRGNQKVLSARLSDGTFLYKEDLETPLEQFNEKLKAMTFQKDLGSVFDKVSRLLAHVGVINDALSLADSKKCTRAALLSKADLASALVKEFPHLQGEIGKVYALAHKEDPEVAAAIPEHWLPTHEGGPLPSTPVGIVLALADKIDNLLGYFSVGLKPTSSSDPFALRRQSMGMIRLLIQEKISCNLPDLFEACGAHFKKPISPTVIQEVFDYLTARARSVMEEMSFKKDTIASSLTPQLINPYDQLCKVQALTQFRGEGEAFSNLFEVYKRAKGILEKPLSIPFDKSLATEPAEKEVIAALEKLEEKWKSALAAHDYTQAFRLMATLQPPLAKLFDTVRINADDPKLRDNRTVLLQKIFAHFQELLDFSQIQLLT